MHTKAFLKEKIQEKVKAFKHLLEKTSIEIALFAVLGAGIAGYNQYNNESRRAEKIPLAFSEIGQTQRDAAKEGRTIGPIEAYSMRLNDMCMKIFEAYNEAQRPFIPGKNTELFATHIYEARDLNNIYKYNLQDLVDTIPTYTPLVQEQLALYKNAAQQLSQANTSMAKSRGDEHDHQFRIEEEEIDITDEDGNVIGTEIEETEVYDHTIHTYDYNKKYGELGSQQLTALFTKIPVLQLHEEIKTTSQTNADGEYAAEKSRSENSRVAKKITEEELLNIANLRYTGSTVVINTNSISTLYPQLYTYTKQRNIDKKTAISDSYITYSKSDTGPREFQTAKKTLNIGNQIENSINQMLTAIQITQDQVPILEQKIQEFIKKGYIHYPSSKSEAKQLEKEIITITKEIYKANFQEGVNVDGFRRGMVLLLGLIGAAAGGVVGAGIDHLGQKTKLYEKIFSKKN